MCGILGGFGDDFALFRKGLAVIHRRGPDDRGEWFDTDSRLFLGHVRLSILDTSDAGHQPMIFADGRVVMVFNGEIYNFHQLRQQLQTLGEHFVSDSDSEVLLALFCRYGIDCLSQLNGIFAVAFWERDSQRLWLARDPLGVKPLYIYEGASGFAFCSEMKGLLRSGICPAAIDAQAVLNHLGYLWSPGESTIVRGIKKVLPGEALCIRQGHLERRWFYYDLPVASQACDRSLQDLTEELAQTVQTAVTRQLVSDVPLGCFLSGGLDSSAVVAFAAKAYDAGQRLNCFSIQVDHDQSQKEGFVDDLPYAKRVAKHLDVDLHVVNVDDSMMNRLPEMIYLLDEPTPDPAALNTLLITELAKQQGIKVLLSGAGGDDIFTGYRRHYAIQQERWWAWLPQNVRVYLARLSRFPGLNSSTFRRVSKAFQYADLSNNDRLLSYFLWLEPQQAMGLLAPHLRAELVKNSLFLPMQETLSRLSSETAPLDKMLYLECKHFLADHNLHYTDKMGMASGVEVRVPLLDLDLVQFAASLPLNLKQHGQQGKWIFKKAMEPYLPHDVIYRSKTGFGVPLRQWLQGCLQPIVDDVLSPNVLKNRGIFDPEAVSQLIQKNRSGQIDATYPLFGIVCMELWCRQHLDGQYVFD